MAKAKARPPLPPLVPVRTSQFKKDAKAQVKRGKDLGKLRVVIETLCSRRPLAAHHEDHPLGGRLKGWRDCHVEPDWLLIYKVTETELILGQTGSHSDLF